MKEESLFHLALEKPPDERVAFLADSCAGDAELRERVELLLRAHTAAGSFLNHPPFACGGPREETVDWPGSVFQDTEGGDEAAHPGGSAPLPDRAATGTHVRLFGDYELLAEIARGGMGVVYKARQISLNRIVAVKMILAGQLATQADHDRFHSEARAAALLDHPNIIPVFEVGEKAGQHYYSMGYVDGGSLEARLSRGPLAPKEAAAIVVSVAEAVEYAHRQGVIHRDIKPSNVLMDSSGRPRVADFGLAKRVDDRSDLTAAGQTLGTPSYMPPEQAAGDVKAIGPLADVYALGALLYTTLAGRPPFHAATQRETLNQVIERDPVALRQLNSAVPRDLETIALKCLQKSPQRRYPSAQALADDLQRYLQGRPIVARPAGLWERGWRWCRREPVLAGLSAAIALLVLLVALASTWGYMSTSQALSELVKAQHQRVGAQVEVLRRADISQVPYLVEDLKPYHAEILPELRQSLLQPDLPDKERLRLSLAMAGEDDGQVAYLRERLLAAEPAEFLVIRTVLFPRRDELAADTWRIAEDPSASRNRRLHALCALAAFDPKSTRWKSVARPAVEALVAENPLVLATWVEALRPIRQSLYEALGAIFRNRQRGEGERSLAANILADYAADRPQLLAELVMDADERQFAIIYPKFKEYAKEGLPALRAELEKPMPDADVAAKEALAERQANAAVALMKLNQPDGVWALFKHSPDPRTRSYLIHRLAPLGVDASDVVHRFQEETDVSSRRALILCLGEFDVTAFPESERQPLAAALLELYRSDPDPGLHAAAEWLLRQKGWDKSGILAEIDTRLAVDENHLRAPSGADKRRWYVNTQGQTFVILDAGSPFWMGSPLDEDDRRKGETFHRQVSRRTFAIASKAVTKAQFRRFQEANPDVWRKNPEDEEFSLTDDSPQVEVDWYDAARYCNWLSEQEGIPKDQFCYLPNAEGKFAEGMRPATDYLERVGYRLPTEAEWEFACRAGGTTSRYYGSSSRLLPQYAWFVENSKLHAWPAGIKKPNDYGLFDMLGNVWEWCDDVYAPYGREDSGHAVDVKSKVGRVLRGGSFFFHASFLRSAYRLNDVPTNRDIDFGLRVARSYR